MRAAKLWLLVGMLWSAPGSLALAQEWPSPFRHLPENTMGVAHVRLDAILKSEWGKAVMTELLAKKDMKEALMTLKSELGVDVLDIESFTFVLLDPPPADERERRPSTPFNMRGSPWNMAPPRGPTYSGPKPLNTPSLVPPESVVPPPPPPFPGRTPNPVSDESGFVSLNSNDDPAAVLIVNVRKPIDRKQFVRKKTENLGRWGIQFLSDQTFVIGPDSAVVQFAANTSDKESELGRQLAQEVARPMIQGGYRLTPAMKKSLASEPGSFGPLSLVFPLLNVTTASFALDFGKIGDIKIRLNAANEKQANLTAQSAKTLLAMTEVACDEMINDLEKSVADAADDKARGEIRGNIVITRGFRDMAKTARVDQRQSEVTVTMLIDIPVRQVVPMLEGIINGRAVIGPTRQQFSH